MFEDNIEANEMITGNFNIGHHASNDVHTICRGVLHLLITTTRNANLGGKIIEYKVEGKNIKRKKSEL